MIVTFSSTHEVQRSFGTQVVAVIFSSVITMQIPNPLIPCGRVNSGQFKFNEEFKVKTWALNSAW